MRGATCHCLFILFYFSFPVCLLFPLYFGFRVLGLVGLGCFWGRFGCLMGSFLFICILGFFFSSSVFWVFDGGIFCILGFMGASSIFYVFCGLWVLWVCRSLLVFLGSLL